MEPISVLTWNLKVPCKKRARKLACHVAALKWDVCLLQEVTCRAKEALKELVAPSSCAFGIDCLSDPKPRAHGAAVLTRGEFAIAKYDTIRELPRHERGVSAAIRGPRGIGFNAVSWHAPNAAGSGVKFKMAGYAGIIACLKRLEGPVILGFDSNHWNLSTALQPPPPPEPGSMARYLEYLFFSNSTPHALRDAFLDYLADNPAEHARIWNLSTELQPPPPPKPRIMARYLEYLFFSDRPPHALRDAFLDYLADNRAEHARILKERPKGPLAVTYIRGKQPDRFDYVFISEHFSVERVAHNYEASVKAGSDHATVQADLRVRPEFRPGLRGIV